MNAKLVHFAKSETDPFFNDKAAHEAYELVMKMDIDEARTFTTMVVLDDLWETIEKNRRTLQGHIDEIAERRIAKAEHALNKSVISKRMSDEPFDEDVALATAGALALISKAVRNPFLFEENDVRRDASGRFTFEIKPKMLKKPMTPASAEAVGIKTSGRIGVKTLPDDRKAAYQSQYLQIANVLRQFDDDDDAMVIVKPKRGRERGVRTTTADNGGFLDARLEHTWDPETEDVVAVQVAPKELRLGGASFGLVSALGGSGVAATRAAGTMEAVDTQFEQGFANEWLKDVDPRSSNARTYNRVKAGSEFVGSVAPAGSKAQIAAEFGEFVGNRGPEAEKVIGPKARKAAYRYRGVTKDPEPELQREYTLRLARDNAAQAKLVREMQHKAITNTASREAKRRNPKAKPDQLPALAAGVQLPKTQRAELEAMGQRRALGGGGWKVSDAARTQARRAVAEQLQRKSPSGALYNLQLKSGHTPPSEGVIINSRDEVVAQAVGYADDHYLPFNLRQLGALRGGEYVRTRSVGGPTAEDVYTGLVTGAKAITVTSRSGTFEIEFEEDFRGTRRYNDKAKRMVNRYEKLLDAVESGKVARPQGVPLEVKQALREKVDAEMGLSFASDEDREAAYKAAETKYRQSPGWTDADDAAVASFMDSYRRENRDFSDGQAAEAEQEFREQIMGRKELNYQLNARGYRDAMLALQEQFPYYIKRAEFYPRMGESAFGASTKDRGYVKPRYNRPAAAQAGYYDSSILGEVGQTGSGKFNADQADFQNLRVREATRSTPQENDTVDETPPETPAAKKTQTPAAPQAQTAASKASLSEVVGDVYSEMYSHPDVSGMLKSAKILTKESGELYTPDEMRAEIVEQGTESPLYQHFATAFRPGGEGSDNAKKLFLGDPATRQLPVFNEGKVWMQRWDTALGRSESKPFTEADRFTPTGFPMTFTDINENLTEKQVQGVMQKFADAPSLSGLTLGDLRTDDEFKAEISAMGSLNAAIAGGRRIQAEISDPAASAAAFGKHLADAGYDRRRNPVVAEAIDHPDRFNKRAELVHRMRALAAVARTKGYGELGTSSKTKAVQRGEDDDDERVRDLGPGDDAGSSDRPPSERPPIHVPPSRPRPLNEFLIGMSELLDEVETTSAANKQRQPRLR